MCQLRHQKLCGPYQWSATSKLCLSRLISSSPTPQGQNEGRPKFVPSSQAGSGIAATRSTLQCGHHQRLFPASIHQPQPLLYLCL